MERQQTAKKNTFRRDTVYEEIEKQATQKAEEIFHKLQEYGLSAFRKNGHLRPKISLDQLQESLRRFAHKIPESEDPIDAIISQRTREKVDKQISELSQRIVNSEEVLPIYNAYIGIDALRKKRWPLLVSSERLGKTKKALLEDLEQFVNCDTTRFLTENFKYKLRKELASGIDKERRSIAKHHRILSKTKRRLEEKLNGAKEKIPKPEHPLEEVIKTGNRNEGKALIISGLALGSRDIRTAIERIAEGYQTLGDFYEPENDGKYEGKISALFSNFSKLWLRDESVEMIVKTANLLVRDSVSKKDYSEFLKNTKALGKATFAYSCSCDECEKDYPRRAKIARGLKSIPGLEDYIDIRFTGRESNRGGQPIAGGVEIRLKD
jgi:hypothetical protein